MEFKINNMTWKIVMKSKEALLEKYNREHGQEAYYVFGYTCYPRHEIWINEELCLESQIKTLKHELTHCYIWCYGMYNVTIYNEEFICDLISASNDLINEVVEKYKKARKVVKVK